MTELELRKKVVAAGQAWLGYRENNGTHKKIIDTYNGQKPLPVGYKVKYTDAWCATYVSAVAVVCGLTDIIFPECSCIRMIELYRKAGRWMENDAYTPAPGDVIFYDWQDGANFAATDNTGAADHVGLVCAVSAGKITVIEGNKSDAVGYRSIDINGRYIRGFGLPDYASKAPSVAAAAATPAAGSAATETKPDADTTAVKTPGGRKLQYARAFDRTIAGAYTVTDKAGAALRFGCGDAYDVIKTIPAGTTIRNYGYYTDVAGVKWLYVSATGSLGFVSSAQVKKA